MVEGRVGLALFAAVDQGRNERANNGKEHTGTGQALKSEWGFEKCQNHDVSPGTSMFLIISSIELSLQRFISLIVYQYYLYYCSCYLVESSHG